MKSSPGSLFYGPVAEPGSQSDAPRKTRDQQLLLDKNPSHFFPARPQTRPVPPSTLHSTVLHVQQQIAIFHRHRPPSTHFPPSKSLLPCNKTPHLPPRPQNSCPAAHRWLGMLRARTYSPSRPRPGQVSGRQPSAGAMVASTVAPESCASHRQSFNFVRKSLSPSSRRTSGPPCLDEPCSSSMPGLEAICAQTSNSVARHLKGPTPAIPNLRQRILQPLPPGLT